MNKETIKQLIETGIDDSHALVEGDDGSHFQATVVSAAFEGKSRVKRHQMVYAALGDGMKAAIHALNIRTLTPSES